MKKRARFLRKEEITPSLKAVSVLIAKCLNNKHLDQSIAIKNSEEYLTQNLSEVNKVVAAEVQAELETAVFAKVHMKIIIHPLKISSQFNKTEEAVKRQLIKIIMLIQGRRSC